MAKKETSGDCARQELKAFNLTFFYVIVDVYLLYFLAEPYFSITGIDFPQVAYDAVQDQGLETFSAGPKNL